MFVEKHETMRRLVNFVLIAVMVNLLGSAEAGELEIGFYEKSCPAAETTVRKLVQQAVAGTPGTAAVLLRLQFHDCFVEGCDASILISPTDSKCEGKAGGNQGVGGYDVIDDVKRELESVCPGVVSCADIVALAARDAIVLAKGPFYEVPTGRRDGRVSRVELAANLPEADDSIQVLKSKFREKGLSDQDLVLLSAGAHTIGFTACFFVTKRLYEFSSNGSSDPSINPKFLPQLKAKCPHGGPNTDKVPLDWGSESVFDDQIFRNINNGFGVIASDSILKTDKVTRRILNSYLARNSSSRADFRADFARAMVKMGSIGVKTGSEGEIRKVCNAAN